MGKNRFQKLHFIMSVLPLFAASFAAAGETAVSTLSEIERTIVAICHTEPSLTNLTGTGFIASSEGLIITADHVIHNRRGELYDRIFCIKPEYPGYQKYELNLVKRLRYRQRGKDIAILKIKTEENTKSLPFLSVGETAEIGQSVLVAGFPYAFKAIYVWPLFRKGTVSSIRYKYENAAIIILDLKSLEGYSGAPIIALENMKVIGIMKGKNIMSPLGDFSVATPIDPTDIKVIK